MLSFIRPLVYHLYHEYFACTPRRCPLIPTFRRDCALSFHGRVYHPLLFPFPRGHQHTLVDGIGLPCQPHPPLSGHSLVVRPNMPPLLSLKPAPPPPPPWGTTSSPPHGGTLPALSGPSPGAPHSALSGLSPGAASPWLQPPPSKLLAVAALTPGVPRLAYIRRARPLTTYQLCPLPTVAFYHHPCVFSPSIEKHYHTFRTPFPYVAHPATTFAHPGPPLWSVPASSGTSTTTMGLYPPPGVPIPSLCSLFLFSLVCLFFPLGPSD